MEALEYYFAERVPLDGFSAASTLDADQRCFEQLPPGFIQANPNRAIEWTTCFDDYTHKKIQVPRHFLSFDLTEARIENGWFKKSTAGLASGNSREEALVHSLCELIEHHAAHAFRALSFEEKKELLLQEDDLPPLPQALMEQLAPHDIQCLIFQMPNVFHIPSFYCLLINTHPLRSLYQYEGYGCHLNAEVALLRAITEAAQSRLTYIAGSRDDMMPFRYQHTTKILSIEATEKKRRFSDIVSRAGLSVVDQLTALQTALKQQGFTQHLYQEHTPDSYPVSVVHSIIPGLCI
jgi:ribosomal protein S12 methylthiotransferase accessory factor